MSWQNVVLPVPGVPVTMMLGVLRGVGNYGIIETQLLLILYYAQLIMYNSMKDYKDKYWTY